MKKDDYELIDATWRLIGTCTLIVGAVAVMAWNDDFIWDLGLSDFLLLSIFLAGMYSIADIILTFIKYFLRSVFARSEEDRDDDPDNWPSNKF